MKLFGIRNDGYFFKVIRIFGMNLYFVRRSRVREMNKFSEFLKRQQNKRLMGAHSWHYEQTGRIFDFMNPKTLTEKILWLRDNYWYTALPVCSRIQNKATFKEWMHEKGLEKHVPKTYGVWESPADIDWGKLPDKFVLKSVMGGDGEQVMLVRDKSALDKTKALREMSGWTFNNKRHPIIAEELLENPGGGGLCDYKFFCIHGKPQFICGRTLPKNSGRTADAKFSVFGTDWSVLPYRFWTHGFSKAVDMPRPARLDEMLSLASMVSAEFPFVRVDMFQTKDGVYVGELTFFPSYGKMAFDPIEYDRIFGDMLTLPRV